MNLSIGVGLLRYKKILLFNNIKDKQTTNLYMEERMAAFMDYCVCEYNSL